MPSVSGIRMSSTMTSEKVAYLFVRVGRADAPGTPGLNGGRSAPLIEALRWLSEASATRLLSTGNRGPDSAAGVSDADPFGALPWPRRLGCPRRTGANSLGKELRRTANTELPVRLQVGGPVANLTIVGEEIVAAESNGVGNVGRIGGLEADSFHRG